MRIVVAGSGRLGVSVIEPLNASRHQVVGVLQNGRNTRGRLRSLKRLRARYLGGSDNVILVASRMNIPVLWLDKMNEDDLPPIARLQPDLVITCGFSIIFREPLLSLPAVGCINVHSSLLPKHRGPSPFSHAVLANERESGVTFHAMDASIDTGDILEQLAFPVTQENTALDVYYKACETTRGHVAGVVDGIEERGMRGTPQDPDQALYDPRITAEDLAIRWDEPAEQIERLVRAGLFNPISHFTYRGSTVHVTRATFEPRPIDAPPGTVMASRPHPRIATGHGTITVLGAYTAKPLMAPWPSFWNRPLVGEQMR